LTRTGLGFGGVALRQLLAADAFAPRAPHFPAKAKHIIYLILNGGMSQVDTFDPKPALGKYHGQPMPGGNPKTERVTGSLLRSPFAFRKQGQSGIEVSEIFPRIGAQIDKFTVIRSMYNDVPNHEPSLFMTNCGAIQPGRPSLGSWLTYGLGTENRNLPGYVVMCPGTPVVGPPLWESAFLPAVYQGTFIGINETDPKKLIKYVDRGGTAPAAQRRQLDLLKELNEEHLAARGGDGQLEATIESMEIAYRMQSEGPAVFGGCGWCRSTSATRSRGMRTKIFNHTPGWRGRPTRRWRRWWRIWTSAGYCTRRWSWWGPSSGGRRRWRPPRRPSCITGGIITRSAIRFCWRAAG